MKHIIQRENGIALFLVLWVLTLLSVIVGEFCYAMRTEVNITRNFKEEIQAYYIAEAGLYFAVTEFIKAEKSPQKAPDMEEEEEEKIRWRINADIPAIEFEQGWFKVNIGNESGKININKATPGLLKILLNGFDLEEEAGNIIVDSIMDWRDKDKLHRLNGAEDDYYNSLPEPYECKDGDFESLEELLLVRGVTPEIFHGGLKDMVIIFQDKDDTSRNKGRGRSKKKSNFNKININAANPRMLLALPLMTEDLVKEIIEYRKENDFKSLNELLTLLGPEVYGAIKSYITLKTSSYFTIQSFGMVDGSRVQQGVQAIVKIDKGIKKGYRLIQWFDTIDNFI